MKLYTKPRRLFGYQLRPGDQIAIGPRGELLNFDSTFVDYDLEGAVRWSVVHAADGSGPIVLGHHTRTKVTHTLGETPMENGECVQTREVFEIDPWSYVQHKD